MQGGCLATIFLPQLFVLNFLGYLAEALMPWQKIDHKILFKTFWGYFASIIWPQLAAEPLDIRQWGGK